MVLLKNRLNHIVFIMLNASYISDREIAPSIPANDTSLYDKTACMSISGLIRPINTSYTSNWLACYEEPNSSYNSDCVSTFMDPFKAGNDIELYQCGIKVLSDNLNSMLQALEMIKFYDKQQIKKNADNWLREKFDIQITYNLILNSIND